MRERLLKAYYFATPGLWLLDELWGLNVRAAGFESVPHFKQIYYLGCMSCALLIWTKPRWTSLIALLESSLNIFSLILGIFAPMWRISDMAEGTIPFKSPLTVPYVINFCLAGTIAYISFQRNVSQLSVNR